MPIEVAVRPTVLKGSPVSVSPRESSALATGVLVSKGLGGVGLVDYSLTPGTAAEAPYDMLAQVIIQAKAVGLTLVWSGVGSAILYKLVDLVIGLRVPVEQEREGLDIASHGERAYNN